MILLDGKKVASFIKDRLKKIFQDEYRRRKYIVIFLLNNHKPSIKYVNLKKKFGQEVGIEVKVISWEDVKGFEDVARYLHEFNVDENCKGIIFQLPLPDWLQEKQSFLLSSVRWYKDIDGLGGINFGLSLVDLFDFIPATPRAVVNILKYYNFNDFKGRNIAILGQSNLVGKPLALYMMKKGATVFSFNKFSDKNKLVEITRISDIIVSATGTPHLVNDEFVRGDKSQILIDVGWEVIDGKIVGDIDFDKVKDKVKAITPVPGGVGPVTVASLFENVVELDRIYREVGDILCNK